MNERSVIAQVLGDALTDDDLTLVAGGSDAPGGPGDNNGAR